MLMITLTLKILIIRMRIQNAILPCLRNIYYKYYSWMRIAYAGHTITTLLCSDLNPNAYDCAYAESNDIVLNYYLMPYKWPTLTLYRNRIPGTYTIVLLYFLILVDSTPHLRDFLRIRSPRTRA